MISPLSDSQKNKREICCCLFFLQRLHMHLQIFNLVRRVHCLFWQVEHPALTREFLFRHLHPQSQTPVFIFNKPLGEIFQKLNKTLNVNTYVLPHFIKVDVEMKFKGSFRINYIARVSITVGRTKLILHWLLSADQPLRIAKQY